MKMNKEESYPDDDHSVVKLSPAVTKQVLDILENPPEPTAKAIEAEKRYQDWEKRNDLGKNAV